MKNRIEFTMFQKLKSDKPLMKSKSEEMAGQLNRYVGTCTNFQSPYQSYCMPLYPVSQRSSRVEPLTATTLCPPETALLSAVGSTATVQPSFAAGPR